jgi:putative oxidoreductase
MSAIAGSAQSAAVVSPPRSKGLHIGLWVAQVALALAFVMAGFAKVAEPLADLSQKMPFVAALPGALVRFIGFSELAGAVGLILPALTRIKPVLTAWAGVGLATAMVLASLFHISRGEVDKLPAPLVLGGIAAFIAWGRFGKARIPSRG